MHFNVVCGLGAPPTPHTEMIIHMWKGVMPMCLGLQGNDPRLNIAQTVGLRGSYSVPFFSVLEHQLLMVSFHLVFMKIHCGISL